jgi:hypothetical protein
MITTTLNRIRAHSPCGKGWTKLLTGLGKTAPDDEPLPYAKIVEINGLDDALWCCRAEPGYDKEWRLYAVWCARQVQHLMRDPRSLNALDVAERYANGEATDDELQGAGAAAWAAARAASRAVARGAARAAAGAAAGATAWAAAGGAAGAAERAAAGVAAWAAAWAAERDAAGNAALAAQKAQFLKVVGESQ